MNVSEQLPTVFSVDQHLSARLNRLSQYLTTMAITFVVLLANLWLILAYGDTAGLPEKLAIAVSIIGIVAFGALGGKAALEEIKAVIDDHVETKPGTRYSSNIAGLPMGQFIALTVVLILLSGLVQLWALFA